MTHQEMADLRRHLEHNILQLLQGFADTTGLVPTTVDVVTRSSADLFVGSASQRPMLLGVRVTAQL